MYVSCYLQSYSTRAFSVIALVCITFDCCCIYLSYLLIVSFVLSHLDFDPNSIFQAFFGGPGFGGFNFGGPGGMLTVQ